MKENEIFVSYKVNKKTLSLLWKTRTHFEIIKNNYFGERGTQKILTDFRLLIKYIHLI